MATVFLFLLLSAFSPPVQNQFITFTYIWGDMNQPSARALCTQKYVDLVTVYSDTDNIQLYNMIQKSWSSGAGWIGLYRSVFSEKWSNGDSVTFTNLTSLCGSSVLCAAMKTDGSWENLPCTETRYFMCYTQDVSSQTRTYYLISENKTWSGAQRYCRSKYTDLISITNQQQNTEVMMKGLNTNTSFWIGLLCDDWQWTDGGNSTYRNWASGHPLSPGNDCVLLASGGTWISVPCNTFYYNNYYFPLCSTFSPPVQNQDITFTSFSGAMNQPSARAVCTQKYVDLVTVYSDTDNIQLYNILVNTGYVHGWIGLYRSVFSEKWSNGDSVTFTNLKSPCGSSVLCAAMKTDGSWENLPCTETRYFMCYTQDVSSQTRTYYLISENKTWSGAQRYCRSKYTDLISITNQQQNTEVMMKGLNTNTSFWIGLLCDDWQWTDGGNSTYRNWASGFPGSSPNDCVFLWSGGEWVSIPCNYDFYPLCSTSSIHVSAEALSWDEALHYCQKGNRAGIFNINSEAEQEALERELGRRGVPPGSLWVGLGDNRLSEMKVSSAPLTCEDVKRQTECPPSRCPAGAAPEYVMDSTQLPVVCRLK